MSSGPRPTPAQLLQQLIRFNTSNPPGYEAALIDYVNELLQGAGISTIICAKDDLRPNLIARVRGRGEAPPLLLYGHVDVVTTADQDWHVPPFAGEIVDGFIWGRGALDMKGGVAMMVSALLRAAAAEQGPPGDLILALLADEEVDSEYGAVYLVQEQAELFDGIRYAIGEGGGNSVYIAGQKFYPIMVAEKQWCSMRAVIKGSGGHGSMPVRGEVMARTGDLLRTLDRKRLPVHITPVVRNMIEAVADNLPLAQGLLLRQLLKPPLTGLILDTLGGVGRLIDPLLHHSVSPTVIRGGHKINVIPSEITLDLDGRLLPGFQPEDMLRELKAIVDDSVAVTVRRYEPGPPVADKAVYDYLAHVLQAADPGGTPIPLLLSGVTDGRHLARLGIQTYGFLPMDLPDGLIHTIHAADERVPVEAIAFGADVLYDTVMGWREFRS